MSKYRCDNCEFEGEEKDLPLAKDLMSRLSPGECYTDRECPKCGSLCFPLAVVEDPDTIGVLEKDNAVQMEQMSINVKWLIEKFDLLHDKFCPTKSGTWQQRVEQVVAALHEVTGPLNTGDYGKIACKNCPHPLEDHDPEDDRCTKCACAGFEVGIS